MKKILVIEVTLTSSTGDPTQLEHSVDEIIGSIKRAAEYELYDDDNKIVYNDWDDPHVCELDINMQVKEK